MAQTTAVAKTDASGAVSPPQGVTTQQSYSGTPRGPDGRTLPDDYQRDMRDPIRRMAIFEEMRADHAVAAAIDARRQEINASNWTLSSEDKTPLGVTILEFVEDNVYPVLDDLLRWLGGGALQYGFAAIEPIYAWADQPFAGTIARGKVRRPTKSAGRMLYLQKLAHLRQPAVETFKISEFGDLEAVVQYAFNGRNYRRVEIAPEKLLLWTYNRQGDDRWGVPPLRHCFKAWVFKTQIEKLNMLHSDRFSVGMPIIEAGEGWTKKEHDDMATLARQWRASNESFLVHPAGGTITIASDDGKTTASMLEWVKYFDGAIAKTYLTQQSELGTTQTGSRAVGDTLFEQLQGMVQADDEEIAGILNERLIKQLVDWNYGPQQTYPAFAPSQRVKLGSPAATMLAGLITAGVVHARPEDEVFARDALGLPSIALETLQAEKSQRDAQVAAAAAATAAAAPKPGDPTPAKDPAGAGDSAPPKPPIKIAATRDRTVLRELALTDGAPTPAAPGTSYRTDALTAWEQGVLRPDVLVRDLDLATSRLAGEVQDVLAAIDDNLEQQASALAARGAAALSAGVRDIAVPERLRKKLRGVLYEAAQRSRDYGAKAVRNEILRQLAPDGVGPQRDSWWPSTMEAPSFYARIRERLRALVAGEPDASAADLHLAAEVDRAVEEEVSRRESGVRTAILNALAQAAGAAVGALVAIMSTAAKAGLIGLSTGRTQSNVQGVVNVGFGVGRSDAAEAILAPPVPSGDGGNRSGLRDANGDPVTLVAKVYSAVMDQGTCEECAKWDGAEFPIDYPEDYTGVQAPNPRCAGGYSRCRCVWVYITDRESVPLVPAAKGLDPAARYSAADAQALTRELTAVIAAEIAKLPKPEPAPIVASVTPAAPHIEVPIALSVTIAANKQGRRTITITKPNGETVTGELGDVAEENA